MVPRFLLLLLLVLPTRALHAQAIRGRLLVADSDVPVLGALVVLQDGAGTRVAQTVSGAEGRFFLRAPSAGSYLLRVLRIGYAPYGLEVRLTAGESIEHNLSLGGTPIALPEISVAGTSQCGARSHGDTLSSALWTQAGTALAITAQTVRSRSYRFETILESRNIDRKGNATAVTQLSDFNVSSWPVRSPPAAELLSTGFISDIDDTIYGPTWYGPDAEFLLSEPFFSGHCFWTVPPGPREPPEWVGLAYEPAVHDTRADIKGTLWLDRQSAELRRLDFQYTRVPRWARGQEGGGALTFAPLPGGGWIVQRWLMNVPLPQAAGSGGMQVWGAREWGGHVRAVLDKDNKELHRYDP